MSRVFSEGVTTDNGPLSRRKARPRLTQQRYPSVYAQTSPPGLAGTRKLGLIDYNGKLKVNSALLNVVLHE
jgi:hypothetical protein